MCGLNELGGINVKPIKCIECKTEVVHYHDSPFCKECGKIFYEGDKEVDEHERLNRKG